MASAKMASKKINYGNDIVDSFDKLFKDDALPSAEIPEFMKSEWDENLDYLYFQRRVVLDYLSMYNLQKSTPGRPKGKLTSANKRVSIDVRTDRIDHFQSQLETQKRCAHCHKNTRKGAKM
ncbi:hypothetical protein HELRODRAFT_164158 [Helobdella robusta]|uniref:Uncharacterized protein n=1 Tax=Helobdella robusta TaxID=6412 RepID=T1EV06_HELRO|nr:hypothetical protein HELRODRAFT_164158 [Helobdella robusta]ESN94333.1 hypothetical protein HELRODRAFT_164158 [Helobdella robusta]